MKKHSAAHIQQSLPSLRVKLPIKLFVYRKNSKKS